MNNLFVPYEIALALKEMGFDEPCIGSYEDNKLSPPPVLHVSYSNQPINTSMWKEEYVETYKKRPKMFEGKEPKNSKMPQWKVAAPLYDQVIDWFIEKHKMDILISPDNYYGYYGCYYDGITYHELAGNEDRKKCRDEAILKAIELIKQKK